MCWFILIPRKFRAVFLKSYFSNYAFSTAYQQIRVFGRNVKQKRKLKLLVLKKDRSNYSNTFRTNLGP